MNSVIRTIVAVALLLTIPIIFAAASSKIQELQRKAAQGDINAQFNLAGMYAQG